MIKHYVTIAVRSILKKKLFAIINVVGLAIGLTVFVFSALLARYEQSHDDFFERSERIYAVYSSVKPEANLGLQVISSVQSAFAPLVEGEAPAVETVARMLARETLTRHGDRKFYENVRFVDPDFLRIFDLDFVAGDPATALADPTGLLLNETTAQKYFGSHDALGQVITLRNEHDLRVTGVFRDLPKNSHFESSFVTEAGLEMLASTEAYARIADWDMAGDWDNLSMADSTYVLLRTGADPATAEAQIAAQWERHAVPDVRRLISGVELRPVSDMNLSIWDAIGLPMMTTLQLLGLLVLVIACLNYVNLATAQLLGRTREVGLRKTMGAGRLQLFTQFVAESVVLTVVALVIAVALIDLLLPVVNEATGKAIAFPYASSLGTLAGLALLTLGVGVVAGGYPAYLIARGRTVSMLNGETRWGRGGGRLRNTMLIAQFTISIFMMISVVVGYAQNDKIKESAAIFAMDEIVVLARMQRDDVRASTDALRAELERVPGVRGVALSSQVPFQQNHSEGQFSRVRGDEAGQVSMHNIRIDEDFVSVYDFETLAGRPLSREYANDVLRTDEEGEPQQDAINVVLNELATTKLGFASPVEAIGGTFYTFENDEALDLEYRVVGVVADLNFIGFFNDIKPTVFINRPRSFEYASVRVEAGSMASTLEGIDQAWARVVPSYPIERRFLRDTFNDVFRVFQGINAASAAFAAVAVLVASIGLFGLAAFMADLRTREVGVRKVMGAGVLDIVKLLVWQFSRPALISLAIAAPLGWLATRTYLNFFADRVALSPLFFLVPGAVALAVAALTVSYHAVRAARTSPVLSLRYE